MKKLLTTISVLGVLFALASVVPCLAAEDSPPIKNSFAAYMDNHLASYAGDNRETVYLCEGGWVKRRFRAAGISSIVIQQTASATASYTATCEFRLKEEATYFHRTKEKALADNNLARTHIIIHRHKYSYHEGKWEPVERRHLYRLFESAEWKDCDEVIKSGASAGQSNLYGCWEK